MLSKDSFIDKLRAKHEKQLLSLVEELNRAIRESDSLPDWLAATDRLHAYLDYAIRSECSIDAMDPANQALTEECEGALADAAVRLQGLLDKIYIALTRALQTATQSAQLRTALAQYGWLGKEICVHLRAWVRWEQHSARARLRLVRSDAPREAEPSRW